MGKPTYYEGQTATNPQTNETLIYSKGRWYPQGFAPPGTPGAGGSMGAMDRSDSTLKSLQEGRDTAQRSLQIAKKAEQFEGMNAQQATGGLALNVPFLGDAMVNASPTLQGMRSITSGVAPGMRPPGSGSSSDKDSAMYTQGFPNVKAAGPANHLTSENLRHQSDTDSARSSFFDSYYRHHGNLNGAQEAWTAYQPRLNYVTKNRATKALPDGIRMAPDGQAYIQDPTKPGSYVRVDWDPEKQVWWAQTSSGARAF